MPTGRRYIAENPSKVLRYVLFFGSRDLRLSNPYWTQYSPEEVPFLVHYCFYELLYAH